MEQTLNFEEEDYNDALQPLVLVCFVLKSDVDECCINASMSKVIYVLLMFQCFLKRLCVMRKNVLGFKTNFRKC